MNFSLIKENIFTTLMRFPLSFLFSIGIGYLFILKNHNIQFYNFDFYYLIDSLGICMIFSIGFYLLFETLKSGFFIKQIGQIFPILFGWYSYYLVTHYYNSGTIVLLLFFISLLFCFCIPFVKNIFSKNNNNKAYFNFFIQFIFGIAKAVFLGLLLFLIIILGIFAINNLFNLDIRESIVYADIFCSTFFFFGSFFLLYSIPKNFFDTHTEQNKFVKFLVKYIGVGTVIFYFLILYAYSIKILLNFSDWPKSIVSYLVVVFTIIGYFVYILSHFFDDKKERFAVRYRKIFPYFILPQLFMLFYAIFLRIHQYSLTINRYVIVVFGLYSFFISLYFIFSKQKKLFFIPLFGIIFLLPLTVGPLNIYNLSNKLQISKLESDLQKAGILKDSKIILGDDFLKNHQKIDEKLYKTITSTISYLCYNEYNCQYIKTRFKEYIESKNINYTIIDVLDKKLINIADYDDKKVPAKDNSLYLHDDILFPINISGYSKLYYIQYNTSNYKIDYNDDTKQFILLKKDKVLATIDGTEILKKMKKNNTESGNNTDIKENKRNTFPPFLFQDASGKKYIFYAKSITITKYRQSITTDISGYLGVE